MICSVEFEKGIKKIETNHLIVLCEIEDDYKSFCQDLQELIKSKSNRNLVSKVYRAMQKDLFITSSKYKNFIEKHKQTIEIMKKYSCLSDLTILSYDINGKRKENLAEDYFYQYIQNHKEDIETIKSVALKIKKLGFNVINFGEQVDFTGIEYNLDTSSYDVNFAYLENMEVIPTYLSTIKYRTNDSCYCLALNAHGFVEEKEVTKYNRNIKLNSLIFDPNRLPNEITTESTISVIYELAQKKKAEYDDLRHSVDLSISISDFKDYFECLKAETQKIDKIKDNQKLVDLVSQMQNNLTKLQLFGVNFENQVINSYTNITDETMKREKKLYLDRRR